MVVNHSSKCKFSKTVGLDILKMALSLEPSGITEKSFEVLKSFLRIKEDERKFQTFEMIDLINFTDFIDLAQVSSLFESNRVMDCLAKLKTEKTIVSELLNQNLSWKSQSKNADAGFVKHLNQAHSLDFQS